MATPISSFEEDLQTVDRFLKPYVHKAAAYITTIADRIIGVDTTGAAVQITLGSVTVAAGRVFLIKDVGGNAAVENITVIGESGETIDGVAGDTIDTNYGSRGYISDGTNWFKV